MKVKIISDGTNYGTRLIDPDTGRDIGMGLKCTRIEIIAGDPVTAILTCVGLPFEVVSGATVACTVAYDREDIDSIDEAIRYLQSEREARTQQ